ncbi:acyltransferase family protein [Lacinutrix algicola]|uniref:acyltransferase family protein n=1 Tax=Lacinutrix algicola TaxID=342954 RepID=UPI0006E270AF|nr:acyltransferase [Lacinutrix algicola]
MRINNFDFLRFVFATLVLVSHSYPLSINNGETEWLLKITNNQISWSSIGLAGFFSISGYLIYQSLQRSKSLIDYFWKRILRLFPALIVVLLLTVFLAPFVYESNVPYYKNGSAYYYFFRNISLYNLQYSITGVFENNPYPKAINGSLWTICYEFTMYSLLAFFYFVKTKTNLIKVSTLVVFIAMYVGYNFFMDNLGGISVLGMYGSSFLKLCTYFVFGSVLAMFKIENLKYKNIVFWSTLVLVLVAVWFDFYKLVTHFTLPIIILLFGLKPLAYLKNFGKYGDASYGIYIYGFPIQQTLMYYFDFGIMALMFYSILLSFIFGYLSWHLIEKKALIYKKLFQPKTLEC